MNHIIWIIILILKGFYWDVIHPTWTTSIGLLVYQAKGFYNEARTERTVQERTEPSWTMIRGPLIRWKTCLLPWKLRWCKMFKVWSGCWSVKGHSSSEIGRATKMRNKIWLRWLGKTDNYFFRRGKKPYWGQIFEILKMFRAYLKDLQI